MVAGWRDCHSKLGVGLIPIDKDNGPPASQVETIPAHKLALTKMLLVLAPLFSLCICGLSKEDQGIVIVIITVGAGRKR